MFHCPSRNLWTRKVLEWVHAAGLTEKLVSILKQVSFPRSRDNALAIYEKSLVGLENRRRHAATLAARYPNGVTRHTTAAAALIVADTFGVTPRTIQEYWRRDLRDFKALADWVESDAAARRFVRTAATAAEDAHSDRVASAEKNQERLIAALAANSRWIKSLRHRGFAPRIRRRAMP